MAQGGSDVDSGMISLGFKPSRDNSVAPPLHLYVALRFAVNMPCLAEMLQRWAFRPLLFGLGSRPAVTRSPSFWQACSTPCSTDALFNLTFILRVWLCFLGGRTVDSGIASLGFRPSRDSRKTSVGPPLHFHVASRLQGTTCLLNEVPQMCFFMFFRPLLFCFYARTAFYIEVCNSTVSLPLTSLTDTPRHTSHS